MDLPDLLPSPEERYEALMYAVQRTCDEHDYAYPPLLIEWLQQKNEVTDGNQ